jgi:hypothetical protein
MQKVVGSSPIIRSESPADRAMPSSKLKTMAAGWLHSLTNQREFARRRRVRARPQAPTPPGLGSRFSLQIGIPVAERSDVISHSPIEVVTLLHGSRISAEGHPRGPVAFPGFDSVSGPEATATPVEIRRRIGLSRFDTVRPAGRHRPRISRSDRRRSGPPALRRARSSRVESRRCGGSPSQATDPLRGGPPPRVRPPPRRRSGRPDRPIGPPRTTKPSSARSSMNTACSSQSSCSRRPRYASQLGTGGPCQREERQTRRAYCSRQRAKVRTGDHRRRRRHLYGWPRVAATDGRE